MQLSFFPTQYSSDFETFWKVYGPVPNQSKPDAFKAWSQTKKIRPATEIILRCVVAYNKWIIAETKKRRARNQNDYMPKCHAASWLRARKWESWMESAESNPDPKEIAAAKDRADRLFRRGKYSDIQLARFED